MKFIAQDITSGTFLDWDVPLSDPEIEFTLSGSGSISGSITPEWAGYASTLEPWGCWLHVEDAGKIRASAILLPNQFDNETLKVTAEGYSGYPNGIPWLSEYSKINVDPMDVVRDIWAHVQSFPQSNLGVTLNDIHTPVRIGTEPADSSATTGSAANVAGPYLLNWWDNKDCGSEIDSLAKSTPFDYRESPSWNADKTAVNPLIELGYPRVGRKRYDLRFAQEENILEVIPVAEVDDEYASDVLVIGQGEGKDAIRGYASQVITGRLRRVVTITDKSLTTVKQASAFADDELRRRQASLLAISSITVDVKHINAPFGSFHAGDDILVKAHLPWIGEVGLWHRITSYSYLPTDEKAKLTLKRSETFRYGRDDIFGVDVWTMGDPVLSVMGYTTIVS